MSKDPHLFLYEMQTKGQTTDWLPFRQSAYIRNVLHGGESESRSPHQGGVCLELCTHVLKKWMPPATPSSDPIGKLDQRENAEAVEELTASIKGSCEAALEHLRASGLQKNNGNGEMFITTSGDTSGWKRAVERTLTAKFSLIAFGGLAKTGHAIIAHAPSGSIFDPNVGYVRGNSSSNYTWIFLALIREYNLEYTHLGSSIRLFDLG